MIDDARDLLHIARYRESRDFESEVALLALFRSRVRGLAYRFDRLGIPAGDLVQDAWEALFGGVAKFDPNRSTSPWAYLRRVTGGYLADRCAKHMGLSSAAADAWKISLDGREELAQRLGQEPTRAALIIYVKERVAVKKPDWASSGTVVERAVSELWDALKGRGVPIDGDEDEEDGGAVKGVKVPSHHLRPDLTPYNPHRDSEEEAACFRREELTRTWRAILTCVPGPQGRKLVVTITLQEFQGITGPEIVILLQRGFDPATTERRFAPVPLTGEAVQTFVGMRHMVGMATSYEIAWGAIYAEYYLPREVPDHWSGVQVLFDLPPPHLTDGGFRQWSRRAKKKVLLCLSVPHAQSS